MTATALDCRQVSERLPWWWNGTLPPEERRSVASHLDGCPSCRLDAERLEREVELFGAHLPAPVLGAHAAGEATPIPSSEIERHLEECDDCRSELELMRAGMPAPVGMRADREPAERPPRWRALALAAAVMAGLASIGLLVSWRQSSALREELAGPRLNVGIAELLPEEMLRRGGVERVQEVRMAPGLDRVTLLLAAPDARPGDVHLLELSDANGETVWRRSGLRRLPAGGFSVSLAASELGSGPHTLRVYAPGDDAPIASYRFVLAPEG